MGAILLVKIRVVIFSHVHILWFLLARGVSTVCPFVTYPHPLCRLVRTRHCVFLPMTLAKTILSNNVYLRYYSPDERQGTLRLSNLTKGMAGKYVCRASNTAGSDSCSINLDIITRTYPAHSHSNTLFVTCTCMCGEMPRWQTPQTMYSQSQKAQNKGKNTLREKYLRKKHIHTM